MKRNGNRVLVQIAIILGIIACCHVTVMAGELLVTWDANTESDLSGYKVHYGTTSRQYSSTVNVGKATQYQAVNLTEGIEYFFAVTAYDKKNNESGYSEEVSAVVPIVDVTAPDAPTILSGQVNELKITIQWTQNSEPDFVGYKVYYGTTSGSYPNEVLVGNSQTFTTPELSEGVIYFFAVSALDTAGNESNLSSEYNIYIPMSDTNPPSVPVIISNQVIESKVMLTWQGGNESDLAGYRVHYGKLSGDYDNNIDVGSVNIYQTTELEQGETYFFAVSAYDTASNFSDYSAEMSVIIPVIDKTAPAQPVVLAYSIEESKVNISWQNNTEPDLAGYKVHYGKSQRSYDTVVDVGVVTQYQTAELIQGDTYFFALSAYDTASNASMYSNEFSVTIPIIDTTPPGTPSVLTYDEQDSRVNIAWQQNTEPDLAGYTVHYGKGPGSYSTEINVGTTTSYQTPELDQGFVYFFAISAYDTAGNRSTFSSEFSVYIPVIDVIPPAAPVISSYNVQDSRVNISWQGGTEPDLAGYVLHYGKDTGNYASVINVGMSTTYQTPVLDEGDNYYFAVTAYDTASNISQYSSEISITIPVIDRTPPQSPEILSADVEDSRVMLVWQIQTDPDLAGYTVHYGLSSGNYPEQKNVGRQYEYATPQLEQGLTYFFALSAIDTAGNRSAYSNEVKVSIPIIDDTAPVTPDVTGYARIDNRVRFEWNANTETDLVGYRIYYGNASKNYNQIIEVGVATEYTTPVLTEGLTYFFAISAYDTADNESALTDEFSVTIPISDTIPPMTPEIVTFLRDDDRVSLTWTLNNEPDLDGFRVSYGTQSSNYNSTIDLGVVNTYTTSNLNPGSTYFFVVASFDTADNYSEYSNEVSVYIPELDTDPPQAPTLANYSRQGDKVFLSWNPGMEPDLSGYTVKYGKMSGSYDVSINTGTVTNYTTPDLDQGFTYFFALFAVDTAGNVSDASVEVSVRIPEQDLTPPAAPVIAAYDLQEDRVHVQWQSNSEPDLAAYRFHYGQTSGQYSQHVNVGMANQYTTPPLVAGARYFFAVSALDTAGNESGYSSEISLTISVQDTTPPNAPEILSWNRENKSVVLAWMENAEQDIMGYRIYFGKKSGDYTQSADVGLAYNFKTGALESGYTYYFSMTAYDTVTNESAHSQEVIVTIPEDDITAPAPPVITNYGRQERRFHVSWAANGEGDISGYRFYYGTVSHQYDSVQDLGLSTEYLSPELDEGKTYFFTVAAYDTAGNQSDYANENQITIPEPDNDPPAPPQIASYSREDERVHLSWHANSEKDVAKYVVHYGATSGTYDHTADAGLSLSYVSPVLTRDKTYYFTLTATDTAGNVSDYSAEVSLYIPDPDLSAPDAPQILSHARNDRKVHLLWATNQEPDLAGYKIHLGTQSGNFSTTYDLGLAVEYTTNDLVEGNTYYFVVSAYDTVGNMSDYSNEVNEYIPKSDTTPPSAPVISTYERRGDKVYVDWATNSEADVAGYTVHYGKTSGSYGQSAGVGMLTEYTTPDLERGFRYYFVVSAADTAGNVSVNSTEVNVFIPDPDNDAPSAPVISTYERRGDKVYVDWAANSEADVAGYTVHYGKTSGDYSQSTGVGMSTEYTTPDLERGFRYYFVVSATDTAGNSSLHSTEVNVFIPEPDNTPPARPVISRHELQVNNQVVIQWQPGAEADLFQYRVYYGMSSGNYSDSVTVNNVTTQYTTPVLPLDATFFFVVAASDTAGNWSGMSDEVSVHIPKPVDTISPAQPVLDNYYVDQEQLHVSWLANTEPDLAGYRLYYSVSQGDTSHLIDVGNETRYTTAKLTPGATYYFGVAAYDLSGNVSVYSEEKSVTVPAGAPTPPQAPVLTNVRVEQRKVRLFWNPVTHEHLAGYRIYYGTESGNYTVVLNANNVTEYVTDDLMENTNYYFVVTAYDSYSNESAFSNVKVAFIPIIDITPPTIYDLEVVDAYTLRLEFSEPVEKKSAETVENYTITNSISIASVTLGSDQKSVSIATSKHQKGNYVLSVSHVTDLAENPNQILSGSSVNYEYDPGDITPPEIAGIDVIDGTHLDVRFNEEVEKSSAESVDNYAINKGITILGASLDADNITVHLTTTAHKDDEQYILTINDLTDRASTPNRIKDNSQINYTYNEADTTPPGIYAVEVISQTEIKVVYTEHVEQVSAENKTNYTIHDNVSVISAQLENDMRSVVLATTKHEDNVDYVLEVNNVEDQAFPANMIPMGTQYSYRYVPLDTIPPEILDVVAVNENVVEITFSEPVEISTAETVSNYVINNGVDIVSARLMSSQRSVQLSTSAHEEEMKYTLQVSHIQDRATVPNIIVENTEFNYIYRPIDLTPPTVNKVIARESDEIDVFFSEIVDRASAEDVDNYAISKGIKITSATLYDDLKTVLLSTSDHVRDNEYELTVNNIKDRAMPANIMTSAITKNYTYDPANHTLTGNLSDPDFEFAYLVEGDAYYVDRSYEIKGIPQDLQNLLWLKTPNDDRSLVEEQCVSFDLYKKATIYIAYDSKAYSPPNWLKDHYRETSYVIEVSGYSKTFQVWEKIQESGLVTLGGNMAQGAYGAESMYFALLKEDKQGIDGGTPDVKDPLAGGNNFALFQNYPNPFNSGTEIRYQLPENCHVTLTIYNILGQTIQHLVRGEKEASHYVIHWDGRNSEGNLLPSGVYFLRLEVIRNTTINGKRTNQVVYDNVRKMIYLK
ncbi:MAG: fibronectin type III domain-containing protein [candidate division KSB1 bacterium]|jgi:hypothetical protein|nr:fibronectin type III domain-containing protein [candidate division KSB1 bacterium]